MKHIFFFVILAVFVISNASAQQYKLVISKKDGTSVEMKTSEINQMSFEEYTDEEQETQVDTLSSDNIEKAQKLLDGDIVLSTNVTMNGVNKTLLDSGCPVKYNFTWNEDSTINISQFVRSPFVIDFTCNVKLMVLNSWEKDEYTGNGWIKFQGENGEVKSSDKDVTSDDIVSNGAYITGYVNVETESIELMIAYNMMNISSEIFMQTIDKNRINYFEEEFAQYEKDLEEWKNSH